MIQAFILFFSKISCVFWSVSNEILNFEESKFFSSQYVISSSDEYKRISGFIDLLLNIKLVIKYLYKYFYFFQEIF